MADDELFTVTARLPRALVDRMDAYVELLQGRTPGMKFTRTDVLRIAIEELTRDVVKPATKKVAIAASEREPKKVGGGRR